MYCFISLLEILFCSLAANVTMRIHRKPIVLMHVTTTPQSLCCHIPSQSYPADTDKFGKEERLEERLAHAWICCVAIHCAAVCPNNAHSTCSAVFLASPPLIMTLGSNQYNKNKKYFGEGSRTWLEGLWHHLLSFYMWVHSHTLLQVFSSLGQLNNALPFQYLKTWALKDNINIAYVIRLHVFCKIICKT